MGETACSSLGVWRTLLGERSGWHPPSPMTARSTLGVVLSAAPAFLESGLLMIEHELKCWPDSFAGLWDKTKTFELRYNDRNYTAGDTLRVREWNNETEKYTGREVTLKVLSIKVGGIGHFVPLARPWVIMSIRETARAEPTT